uniref:Uncharacterized protein n=1 Tax=Tanacetum cinerariifolium TaxID=118510 RepID=A0A6L2LW11_TANCI|nr:hypothetical protein [Tanacetum cinerariifolium]
MRIEQYIQMMNYALWEVIENGATLPKTQVVEGVTIVMPITSVEEKTQRRLKVKARSTLMMDILNEHQLKFNLIKDAKQLLEAIKKTFGQRCLVKLLICFKSFQPSSPQLIHEDLEQIHPDDMEEIDLRCQMAMLTIRARRECKALRNQDNKHKESLRRSVLLETTNSLAMVSCDGLGGYDWSDLAEEGPNYVLMAFTSSNSDSKIVDNCKKGLRYENYNAVPPLDIGNFMPLTHDLSYTCLDEFANKTVAENTKSGKEETKVVRKNDDAPVIEEWVSGDEEKNVTQHKIEKNS